MRAGFSSGVIKSTPALINVSSGQGRQQHRQKIPAGLKHPDENLLSALIKNLCLYYRLASWREGPGFRPRRGLSAAEPARAGFACSRGRVSGFLNDYRRAGEPDWKLSDRCECVCAVLRQ